MMRFTINLIYKLKSQKGDDQQMFKMKPIQFKFQPNFTPTKEIYDKYIIAEPFEWDNGYGISFIIEVEIPLEGKIIGSRIKTLERYDYFDKNIDYELSLLLHPLFYGEIRGKYAEKIVWNIFYKLCKKEKWLEDNFPEYAEFINKQ